MQGSVLIVSALLPLTNECFWPIVLRKSDSNVPLAIDGPQSYAIRIKLQRFHDIASFDESIMPDFVAFSFLLLQFWSPGVQRNIASRLIQQKGRKKAFHS
jgi:hypothetical protein